MPAAMYRCASAVFVVSPTLAAALSMDCRAAVRDCIASVERGRGGVDGMRDDANDDMVREREDDLALLG